MGPSTELRRLITPRGRGMSVPHCLVHHDDVGQGRELHTYELLRGPKPFRALAAQVVPAVLSGRYCALIGDDTSGRVPALVLREVLRRRLAARGDPGLPLIFWRGGKVSPEVLHGGLDERRHLLDAVGARTGRVLLVTEYVQSGVSIRAMVEALRERTISCDLAMLGSREDEEQLRRRLGVEALYSAEERDPFVFGLWPADPPVTGMNRRARDGTVPRPVNDDPARRRRVACMRHDVKLLGELLA